MLICNECTRPFICLSQAGTTLVFGGGVVDVGRGRIARCVVCEEVRICRLVLTEALKPDEVRAFFGEEIAKFASESEPEPPSSPWRYPLWSRIMARYFPKKAATQDADSQEQP